MGTIKIGQAEELLISKIGKIKEDYKMRFDGALRGLRIANNQIADSKDSAIKEIKKQLEETIKRAEKLSYVIQGIEFSKEYDEDKFFVSWSEWIEKTGSYYGYGFGKNISKEAVSEKQFIFALTSWEREISKRLILFRELEGKTYDPLCSTLEVDIRKMLHEYVVKN